MTTQIIIRVDPDLKNRVNDLAKAEGKTTSEVVRKLLEEYIRDRDIGSYIDDLWDRIGGKISSKGFGPRDVQAVIRDVRSKKV